MNSNLHFRDTIFQPLSDENFFLKELNKFLFVLSGSYVFGNINSSSSKLGTHFRRGIHDFSQINSSKSFNSYADKSIALISAINDVVKSERLKSVSILLSGGKDSALLAKILSLNGIEVNAYHVTRNSENHPSTKKNLERLHVICEKLGISKLNVAYGGVSPNDLLKQYNSLLFSSTAANGCANLFSSTNIKNQEVLCFAQGADTLSNVVHNQHPYFNNSKPVAFGDLKDLIRSMYISTYPKFFKLLGYEMQRSIFNQSKNDLKILISEEFQKVSRFVGMYLVHTPMDSKFIYDIAELNNLSVFNPFHFTEVIKIFMSSVNRASPVDGIKKIEIEIAIKELGLDGLNFDNSGFKVDLVSNTGNYVKRSSFNRELLSLVNN
jgi:asparagine synthetase B (glutamine-hydrolysing)